MGLAFLFPEPEKTAPGKKSKVGTLSDYKSVGATRLSQARAVLRHSRELAEAVRDGTIKLGVLSRVLEKAPYSGGRGKIALPTGGKTKTQALKASGISTSAANR